MSTSCVDTKQFLIEALRLSDEEPAPLGRACHRDREGIEIEYRDLLFDPAGIRVMRIATGKVVGGRIGLDAELPEGASVTVLALDDDETFEADAETERAAPRGDCPV